MRSFFLLCFCLSGCVSPEQPVRKPTTLQSHKDTSLHAKALPVAKSIEDLQHFIWRPYYSDTSSYACEVRFYEEYALIMFSGQCAYFFFTNTAYASPQVISLDWTFKTDCVPDMSFLEESNGVKHYPKHGDMFANYRLINDSTVSVEYMFPQWVAKVNKIAQDSIFPQRLYLVNIEH